MKFDLRESVAGLRGIAVAAVLSMAAVAAASFSPVDHASSGTRRLRLGVLSDLHIVDAESAKPFEAVLRIFDKAKVDGVIVCGDLTDYGTETQLELVADTWFRVFPGGKRSDGEPVANLMHYGDHDICTKTYRERKLCLKLYPDEDAMRRMLLMTGDNRKTAWERCFREPWAPIVHKRVKGYDFVLAHFTRGEKGNEGGNNTPGLAKFMSTLKIDPEKPFFFSQHRIYRNTVCGPHTWGQDDGSSAALLSSKHPNAIAFCGHGHQCSANDQILWQGGFTAIETPGLRYCIMMPGRENGFAVQDWPATSPAYTMNMQFGEGRDFIRQGLIVDVYDSCIKIGRHEFKHGDTMGHDFTVPLPSPGSRPFAFENRSRTVPAPVFPEGARISVREVRAKDRLGIERDMYELSFPPASMTADTPRANEYEVCVETQWGDVVKTVATRRFYSSAYNWGDRYDRKPVICRMLKSDVPDNRPARFVARAMNSYYVRGKPLSTEYFRKKGGGPGAVPRMFPRLSVDAQGVLRTEDWKETNLFGVNYYPCFAYWNTALDRAGKSPYETMRMDVAHFRRLGLDCIRIHCFDRQISDAEGHLVDPGGHLERLDYLIALCASNGISTVLTPMAHWGAGGAWKKGFCDVYCKDGYEPLVGDEKLWAVQATFLKEFASHRNPHRDMMSYAEDPAIPCFELVNEPHYPKGIPAEKVTRYINTLADAMRSAGVRKPLFYNPWKGYAQAAENARIDGVTAAIYPTGLNLGRERRGNQLMRLGTKSLFSDGEGVYKAKARMIYEFDTADTTASCLYPVLAYVFRHSKAQIAAQFEYDPVLIADSNAALHTHYLNLVYTPAKAISLAIAREVFRVIPRGAEELANGGRDVRFGPFRCAWAGDLSEMVSETDFLYTNDTASRPPAPEKLRRIWGHGSSPLVASDGSGAYFLDRMKPGVWRLQAYPNIHCADDPFARHNGVKRAVKKGTVTFRIDVPDLGPAFKCTVEPGDWVLEKGRVRSPAASEIAGAPSIPRYEAPPPADVLPPVRKPAKNKFAPVREVCSGFASREYVFKACPLDITDGDAVYVTARALRPDTKRLEFILRKDDGGAWSVNLDLTMQWQKLRIPLSDFKYRKDKTVVPPDGKTLAPLSECEACEFIMGRWLFPKTFSKPHGYEVRYVGSVPEI